MAGEVLQEKARTIFSLLPEQEKHRQRGLLPGEVPARHQGLGDADGADSVAAAPGQVRAHSIMICPTDTTSTNHNIIGISRAARCRVAREYCRTPWCSGLCGPACEYSRASTTGGGPVSPYIASSHPPTCGAGSSCSPGSPRLSTGSGTCYCPRRCSRSGSPRKWLRTLFYNCYAY